LVEELRREGCAAYAIAGDVRDEEFAEQLVAEAVRRFGGLDIAFNNAGTLGPLTSTPAITLDQWTETIETNLTSAFLGAKHQAPAMMKRGTGSIIFTSTFVGYTACFAGTAAYAASKSGLIGLTQALALEFAPNIRVNALIPGGTDTPMARAMNSTEEDLNHVRSLHALGRISTPEEQARSVLYLASDASSFTSGTALLVDGGVSIKRA
jgi:NAD(P)-dependent dehydrogenase (short-subunit alcohol dehydrogenase family)